MTKKKMLVTIILLFLASIGLVVLIDRYSKVNSLSRGFLMDYVLYPVLFIEAVMMVLSFFVPSLKTVFVIQIILAAIVLGWFIYYVFILK